MGEGVVRVHHYDATPVSCRLVRRDVQASLDEWRVDEDAVENAVLVANELASNVVDHAHTPFTLTLTLTPGYVRIELTDGSSEAPILRVHDASAVRGRGLQMVAALSSEWTYFRHDTGKTVVADMHADGPLRD